jgi:hypothetical protein
MNLKLNKINQSNKIFIRIYEHDLKDFTKDFKILSLKIKELWWIKGNIR